MKRKSSKQIGLRIKIRFLGRRRYRRVGMSDQMVLMASLTFSATYKRADWKTERRIDGNPYFRILGL